jgi:hypothetical protein
MLLIASFLAALNVDSGWTVLIALLLGLQDGTGGPLKPGFGLSGVAMLPTCLAFRSCSYNEKAGSSCLRFARRQNDRN